MQEEVQGVFGAYRPYQITRSLLREQTTAEPEPESIGFGRAQPEMLEKQISMRMVLPSDDGQCISLERKIVDLVSNLAWKPEDRGAHGNPCHTQAFAVEKS
jgi:hypothetical protein